LLIFSFPLLYQYNYVLSAALDAGTILGIIVVFLALQLPKGGTLFLDWPGNTVYQNTLDWQNVPLLTAPETGFGPDTVSFCSFSL